MGIIEKQASKSAIFSYLGAGLGFFTIMWLSHSLTTDENGLIRILVSVSTLFAQFSGLGFSIVTIRLFPYFRNYDKGHHGFLFYAIAVSLVGFCLCYLGFYFFRSNIIASNIEKSKLFVDYLYYLMPLSFFTLFFNVFDTYLRSCYQSVIGSVSKEVYQRILILGVLALYFFEIINFPIFILGYITATCLPTIFLLYTIVKMKEWHIKPVRSFITRKLAIEMVQLSIYSIFAGISGAIIISIDSIMVNQMLGLSEVGIYSIAFYFGSVILIPAKAINRIATSIVSELFKEQNFKELNKLYNQTCNAGIAISSLLFIGIMVNIDSIMHLLPKEYLSGKNVILFISAGFITEMATGINQVILYNSKYYYYDTIFVFIVVIITVVGNYLLIPIYGIQGSAIATAITTASLNILRSVFVNLKFNMWPYDLNSLKLVFIALITLVVGFLIPHMPNFIVDTIIRSGVVTLVFILLLLKFEATPDINSKIRKILKRLSIDL